MWSSVLTKVVISATEHLLQSPQPNTRNSSRNNHVGMSCNIPQHQDLSRSVAHTSQTSNCSNNCSNSSSGNAGNKNQSQKNFTRKQNSQSNDKILKIALPSDGNYEIKIKRVESDFAKMGQSGSKSGQNARKDHSSNASKPKQQDTNQRQQNKNQKQQNGNQKLQHSNQNKPNKNNNQGTAKFQNYRQGNQFQVSTNANGHSQIKKGENDKNHKPGNLKLGKNYSGNHNKDNKGVHVNNEGQCNKPNGYGHH